MWVVFTGINCSFFAGFIIPKLFKKLPELAARGGYYAYSKGAIFIRRYRNLESNLTKADNSEDDEENGENVKEGLMNK